MGKTFNNQLFLSVFSVAMLCRRKRDSSLVVVKELYQREMSEEDRKVSMNEIQVLSMLRHPNIIAYFDSFTVDNPMSSTEEVINSGSLMIVMEYADGNFAVVSGIIDFIRWHIA